MNYDKIMQIIQEEFDAEMECAEIADRLMRKTLNPIRRISLWRQREYFRQHCSGINLIKARIIIEMEL